jgi:histidyl-tRNA synthetase
LTSLGLPDFTIAINNRKILSGIAEICGEQERIIDITVAIDKLDKIGEEGVVNELLGKGFEESTLEIIKPLFHLNGSNDEVLAKLKTLLANSEIGLKGIEELEFVLAKTKRLGLRRAKLEVDVTLARGLNYYTGAIFEVKANGVKMGSICGGGRYDDLTGLFGLKNMSGVGISFGADRIYDVMNELELFPLDVEEGVKILFVNFGEEEADFCLDVIRDLRNENIASEIYPSSVKLQKQMKYANDKNIPFVALVGAEEVKIKKILLKNMNSGEQELLDPKEIHKMITQA